jgi:hypothetical protein
MCASTTVRHMLNNSIIVLCSACGLLTYQTQWVHAVSLSDSRCTYIRTYVRVYKGKGKANPRTGHKGPEVHFL